MTPDLFPVTTPDQLPELELARRRMAQAQAEFDGAGLTEDLHGVPVPFAVSTELRNARNCVSALEALAIRRMR